MYKKEIMISCGVSLLLSALVILSGIKISISWAYLIVIIVSIMMNQIESKFTCMAYVMPTIFIIDEVFVLSGLKSHYFNLAYVEMILLVGILHCIEGILTLSYGGNRNWAIMTYRGKKVAGGYQAYGKWLIPLLLFSINGIYIPIVAAVVYSNASFVLTPRAKARIMGSWIFVYGLVIIVIGYLTSLGDLPLLFSMISMPILHEILFAIDTHIEQGELLYPYPKQGIRVMDFKGAVPSRIGKMDIEKGDIILKINESRVNTEEEYRAVLINKNMKLVLQKLSGAMTVVQYTYEELEEMKLVFLPPI